MRLMSIDLEMNQPSQKIIQIGVCIGDLHSDEILLSKSWYININEQLAQYIIDLTSIQQTDVDQGVSLDQAYIELVELHQAYNCFINPVTWGGGDSELLRQQLGLSENEYLFGRRWIDAKTLYVSRCFQKGLNHQSGLSKSIKRMGLEFKGKKHNAEDDAINTFKIYQKLVQEFK